MAEQGKALQEKGQEYLDVHGFEKGADALRAAQVVDYLLP